jgi:hypothetical protein
MRKEQSTLIHFHIITRGLSSYETPCGKTGGDYYVTQNKKEVTCKSCKEYNEKK